MSPLPPQAGLVRRFPWPTWKRRPITCRAGLLLVFPCRGS